MPAPESLLEMMCEFRKSACGDTRQWKILELQSWKYNIRRNANSDFSIVTMRRVAIIFFELGVVKNSMPKF